MQDALAETNNLIAPGKLHIPVEKSYTLAEAATAHIDSHAGHTRGRRETPPGPAVRLGALDVACHGAVAPRFANRRQRSMDASSLPGTGSASSRCAAS